MESSPINNIASDGHIPFENLVNTRDIGGMVAKDGRSVKKKTLLRSGLLAPATAQDIEVLVDGFNLHKVIDLRTDEERANKPDPADSFPSTEFVNIPLLNTEALGITRDSISNITEAVRAIAANPVGMMTKIYPQMLLDKTSQKGLARFFIELLENGEGSVLWHCTAGKDRAGVAAFLLLTVLDVPQDLIVQDYLATNKYMTSSTQEILSALASYHLSDELRGSIQVLNSADLRFLQAALDAVEAQYGGLAAFIRDELGVTHDMAEELRAKYLVD